MTRNHNPVPPEGLTPEECRYLDGEMTPQEARSMEHRLAADPERAAQLEAWRDAMDLWRDDAARAAAPVATDPDALADRILAGLGQSPEADRRTVSPTVARWYASAAAVLMAIGITGTILAQPTPHSSPAQPEVADIEDLFFLDLVAESPELAPPLAIGLNKEGR